MVGAVRFELTTSCTRNKRATRLRYAPNQTRRGTWAIDGQLAMDFSRFLWRTCAGTGAAGAWDRALTRAAATTQSASQTICMFSKGQKVVCINDDFPPEAAVLFAELPRKDRVYTVRGMYIGRGNYYRHESGKKDGEIGLLLEEILNPRDPALKTGLNGELGFNSERFAPLETDEESATAEEEAEFSLPTAAG